jgi:hypothetical protein
VGEEKMVPIIFRIEGGNDHSMVESNSDHVMNVILPSIGYIKNSNTLSLLAESWKSTGLITIRGRRNGLRDHRTIRGHSEMRDSQRCDNFFGRCRTDRTSVRNEKTDSKTGDNLSKSQQTPQISQNSMHEPTVRDLAAYDSPTFPGQLSDIMPDLANLYPPSARSPIKLFEFQIKLAISKISANWWPN